MKECTVGQYVYKYGSPQKPGKIISLTKKCTPRKIGNITLSGGYWTCAEVKWIDGTVSGWDVLSLKDFNDLIADHEKKLKTHRDKLPKLQTL